MKNVHLVLYTYSGRVYISAFSTRKKAEAFYSVCVGIPEYSNVHRHTVEVNVDEVA